VLVRLSIGLIGCSQGNIYGYTKLKEFENGQKFGDIQRVIVNILATCRHQISW
jgi:hypothetical protein